MYWPTYRLSAFKYIYIKKKISVIGIGQNVHMGASLLSTTLRGGGKTHDRTAFIQCKWMSELNYPHQSNLDISSGGVHVSFMLSVEQELNYRANKDGVCFH